MKRLASDYDSRKHSTHSYALRTTLSHMHIYTHNIFINVYYKKQYKNGTIL